MATVLAFHAHPDDEVVLTGGTLARLAAEGHRVVLVVATDGYMGEPPDFAGASTERLDEVRASAAVLGVHRVEHLGYADSGHGPLFYPDPPTRTRFARADTEEAAARLADFLREEQADVLLSYEANGGYGHRDHMKVHEVGKRAADLAGTPRVLEVTMPRELLMRGLAITRRLRLPFLYDAAVVPTAYSPRAAITHVIDVRRYVGQKKRAMAAHRSQVAPAGLQRRLALLGLQLPAAVFRPVVGREWFVEKGARRATWIF